LEAPVGVEANLYQYNGKELNEDYGLHWMDYGARWYDPQINRWGQIDPLAEKHYAWSGYNYVLGNPVKLIDPDGRDPMFDENGNFLGHYNDSDFDGEIMVMPANKYQQVTGGRDVVISQTVATYMGGTYLKDRIAGFSQNTALPMQELEFLSDLFTNLLIEADRVGLIEFDRNNLKSGSITVVGGITEDGKEWKYPSNYNNLSPYSGNRAQMTRYSDGSFDVSFSIQYYKDGEPTAPHIVQLSHAGNAISILGVHEYMLHGRKGWDGNHNHYRIYPIQWQMTKDFISPEYRSELKKKKGN
jgi:RHS repeat-associated protein